MTLGVATMEISMSFPHQAKHTDPPIPLLGIFLKGSRSYSRDTCLSVVMAALATVARKWKQYRWPSAGERVTKRKRRRRRKLMTITLSSWLNDSTLKLFSYSFSYSFIIVIVNCINEQNTLSNPLVYSCIAVYLSPNFVHVGFVKRGCSRVVVHNYTLANCPPPSFPCSRVQKNGSSTWVHAWRQYVKTQSVTNSWKVFKKQHSVSFGSC